jgi:hypothetical protein
VKRRDFIFGAAGFAGLSATGVALAQTRPCPVPELRVDSQQAVTTGCSRLPIEEVAASLAPGAIASLGDTGLSSDALFTIQWTNRFFYDHKNARAHLLGKNASSQGAERSHCIYDAAANTWRSTIYGGNETGHIYESFAYDPQEAKPYHSQWGTSAMPVRTWSWGAALDSWSATSTCPWALSSTNATNPAMGWHPNLFGAGDGGLIALRLVSSSNVELVAWRRSTNQWSRIEGSGNSASGGSPQLGAVEYVRGAGFAVATFATGSTFTIGAGSGGQIARPVQISNPPIACRHAGGSSNVGILIDDPTGGPNAYILEKAGSNRVWQLVNGSWAQRSYTHRMPSGSATSDTNWVVASVYPLGVFWGRSNRSGPSTLWRPNS